MAVVLEEKTIADPKFLLDGPGWPDPLICETWGYRARTAAGKPGISGLSDTRNTTARSLDAILHAVLHLSITVLISFRLLRTRRLLEESMQGSKDRVYSRIIAILVESCAMVAIFGLGFAISNFIVLTWTGFQASWIFAIGYGTAVTLPVLFLLANPTQADG
ncbi:hypothetical protein CC1G_07259 [Coprinopsis cinerea okayama7|uniref:Uncharacterized protein n=1 Tax=Coprinopsis cinerea (strain Okayama-7 / 130 / ATCC MYA-4618 / FGSC 9003) TaxID=240176 RepID=A8PD46_COPC7|nr:hypothetical protein CC1G_07259 [Coprinopsis cinerea okayama7\|eukprot:XP_001840529.2 hypothetical protein CC1G_07259 [Coprinopsis cinerea okayama7\